MHNLERILVMLPPTDLAYRRANPYTSLFSCIRHANIVSSLELSVRSYRRLSMCCASVIGLASKKIGSGFCGGRLPSLFC